MSFSLTVSSLPGQNLAFTNCAYLQFDDFMYLVSKTPKGVTTKERIKSQGLNIVIKGTVFSAKPLKDIVQGTIGMGSMQRQSSNCAMNENVPVEVYIPSPDGIVGTLFSYEVQLLTRGNSREQRIIDCEEMNEILTALFQGQVLHLGQLIAVDYQGLPMRLKVTKIDVLDVEEDYVPAGQIVDGSMHKFSKAKDAPIKFTNQQSTGGTNQVFKADFDFSKLGIGGLDNEFNEIFRRAFASRVFPHHIVKQMGIHHVRGMLLFGPPGCGKTLIARQIGKVLNAKDPKIVNGPEILDKFVGESERKIRDLFADARTDQDENGDDAELHIIIFDEIDAVCKARGTSGGGTGVGDSVVNQLLTQIDGVDSLNNVLVIGMTNRKDMLDEALLRPGRLEVQMEINLPDEFGRAQILNIHTTSARENGYLTKALLRDLDSCLNLDLHIESPNLAQRTKNFSGAEIAGLVRAASSHALSRGTDGANFSAQDNFSPEIDVQDFNLAMQEVKPKFGSPKDGLEDLYRGGIISYGKQFVEVQSTLKSLIAHAMENQRTSISSVLLHGAAGTGKTALAVSSAVESDFPFVRLIKPADFIGLPDSAKCAKIFDIFQEAYRSPLSIIIIDDMERLLEYVSVGPRFSNQILQTLMVMVKNPPPVVARKLLVIGITSVFMEMEEIGLTTVFHVALELEPLMKPTEIKRVIIESEVPIAKGELDDIVATFSQPVGVKILLEIIEMAKQDTDLVTCTRFIDCVYKFKL